MAAHLLKALYATPVVTTTAYAANDMFGTAIANLKSGIAGVGADSYVDSIALKLEHSAALDFDLMLFVPTGVTLPADNAAFTFTASQLHSKLAGYVKFAVADFVQIQGTNEWIATKSIPPIILKGGIDYSLAVCVKTGFTPVAVDVLKAQFNLIQMEGF